MLFLRGRTPFYTQPMLKHSQAMFIEHASGHGGSVKTVAWIPDDGAPPEAAQT